MYLSRVEIDSFDRVKIKELSHLGAYHSWVENCFEINDEDRNRKLWRIDELDGRKYLILVSPTKPDLSKLEKYGVIGTAKTKNYSNYLSSLREGIRYRFRVVLNPVLSIHSQNTKRGRVVPHVTAEQQLKYLKDRSLKNGFDILDNNFSIVERGYVTLKKTGFKQIRFSKVTYEGVLVITDISRFINILKTGLGKHKAYGFGLMTVIPNI